MFLAQRGSISLMTNIVLSITAILGLATAVIKITGEFPVAENIIHKFFQRNPLIENISVSSERFYFLFLKRLNINGRVYMDRSFEISQMPPFLNDSLYICTYNDDKNSKGNSFLTFYATKNVEIYIGYDSRFKNIPAWLRDYRNTHETIEVGKGKNKFFLNIYKKAFTEGKIELGGNRENDDNKLRSMYLAIVKKI